MIEDESRLIKKNEAACTNPQSETVQENNYKNNVSAQNVNEQKHKIDRTGSIKGIDTLNPKPHNSSKPVRCSKTKHRPDQRSSRKRNSLQSPKC